MKIKSLNLDGLKEDKKKFDLQEFINTLNTLDPQNIGSWPLAVKVLAYAVVFLLVVILGYVFDISPMQDSYATEEKGQEALLQEFEQKVFKANNLDVYKRQLTEMEDSFGSLLRQLPRDTEVPGLLEDVTHTGLGSGLEFDAIDLAPEQSKEFYSELPINIKVHGDYHAFGSFVSGVSSLPRIVTLQDFKIVPLPTKLSDNGAPVLVMTIVAKTYRYKDVDAGDKKPADKADKPKGGA